MPLVPEPTGHAHGPRPRHRHDDQVEALVRGVRDRVLVGAEGVEAMPENPRDAEGRILYPICKHPIGPEEPTSEGGARDGRPECRSDDWLPHEEESGPAGLAAMLHVDQSISREDAAHRGNLLA